MRQLIELLRLRGLRRGVIQGNKWWFLLWAVLVSSHWVRRAVQARQEVEIIELQPGETLLIRDLRRDE